MSKPVNKKGLTHVRKPRGANKGGLPINRITPQKRCGSNNGGFVMLRTPLKNVVVRIKGVLSMWTTPKKRRGAKKSNRYQRKVGDLARTSTSEEASQTKIAVLARDAFESCVRASRESLA